MTLNFLEGIESFRQRSWDTVLVQAAYNQLLSDALSEAPLACLLAAAWKNYLEPGSMPSQ